MWRPPCCSGEMDAAEDENCSGRLAAGRRGSGLGVITQTHRCSQLLQCAKGSWCILNQLKQNMISDVASCRGDYIHSGASPHTVWPTAKLWNSSVFIALIMWNELRQMQFAALLGNLEAYPRMRLWFVISHSINLHKRKQNTSEFLWIHIKLNLNNFGARLLFLSVWEEARLPHAHG